MCTQFFFHIGKSQQLNTVGNIVPRLWKKYWKKNKFSEDLEIVAATATLKKYTQNTIFQFNRLPIYLLYTCDKNIIWKSCKKIVQMSLSLSLLLSVFILND